MGIIHQNGPRGSVCPEERKETPKRDYGMGGYPKDKFWRKKMCPKGVSPGRMTPSNFFQFWVGV